eukprot:2620209-Rhodomonas_salina.3
MILFIQPSLYHRGRISYAPTGKCQPKVNPLATLAPDPVPGVDVSLFLCGVPRICSHRRSVSYDPRSILFCSQSWCKSTGCCACRQPQDVTYIAVIETVTRVLCQHTVPRSTKW